MKFFKLWFPVFLWAGIIFYLSGLKQISTGETLWDIIFSNAAHIIEYFVLTFLLYRAIKYSFHLPKPYLVFWPFIIAIFYALSDEVHQFFVPTRFCSVEDIIVDTIGIIAFCIYQFS